LWTLANARAYFRYRQARRDPRRAQETILSRFLRHNSQTAYGVRFGYKKIRSVAEYQDAVPIVTYDDLEPWIERIRQGEPNVLTAEPVLMMEKTSGSSGAAKYIPYTASLRREFQNAIGAWMFDLFTRRPGLLGGAHYWSISPCARAKEFTPGGLPIGFDEDTEYLGTFERLVLRWIMAVPPAVCRIAAMDENRRVTLQYLMKCPELRFISVWNPSFLTILMSCLPARTRPRDCWPRLKLISCWTHASSGRFLPELREWFPGVEIQGKGLLATEGIVTFPEVGRPAPSLALTSHFLEFVGDDGRARLADELEVGAQYQVIITTGGGLARYALGDSALVVAPGALEFIGRSNQVSDLCGEKLNEVFVAQVLAEASAQGRWGGFAMLAPEWGQPPRYLLFAEMDVEAFAVEVERRLRKGVHYDYCRRLGQLGPIEGVRVFRAGERYVRACEALGQKPGNIKTVSLRREFRWRQWLGAGQREGDSFRAVPIAAGEGGRPCWRA
jgi:hypothetical protein